MYFLKCPCYGNVHVFPYLCFPMISVISAIKVQQIQFIPCLIIRHSLIKAKIMKSTIFELRDTIFKVFCGIKKAKRYLSDPYVQVEVIFNNQAKTFMFIQKQNSFKFYVYLFTCKLPLKCHCDDKKGICNDFESSKLVIF